uniref:Uncharacterized protein n=1 Tax=Arundo donax TaxID=35708 RepID=A0A0A8ZJ50_ARUDO
MIQMWNNDNTRRVLTISNNGHM